MDLLATPPYHYAVEQLRLFHKYDRQLRQKEATLDSPIPGGYTDFVSRWNLDPRCRWGFTEWDNHSQTLIYHGPAIPESALIPRIPQPQTTHPVSIGGSAPKDDLVNRLLLMTARRAAAQDERQQLKKAERIEKRLTKQRTALIGGGDGRRSRSHTRSAEDSCGGSSSTANTEAREEATEFSDAQSKDDELSPVEEGLEDGEYEEDTMEEV